MIRAEALAKEFGAFRAVDGYTFEVQPGEIYGLLGPNGAGKTTTTRMLSCLLKPTSGSGSVAGYSILTQAHLIRARIGILTEVPGLYERLTPVEYLGFFARVHGLRGSGREARIEEVLRLVGIWERRKAVMRAFSKGMQQRVAIARTLLHDPEVLFFDEPTAALDPEAARNVRDHLLDLTRGRQRSVLLCTHNLPEAEALCRRLSIVQRGRQVAEGTPAELKAGVERGELLKVRAVLPGLPEAISRVAGALQVVAGEGSVAYRTSTPERTNPEVVRAAVGLGAEVLGLREAEVSLEEVYLSLVRGHAGPGAAREGTQDTRTPARPPGPPLSPSPLSLSLSKDEGRVRASLVPEASSEDDEHALTPALSQRERGLSVGDGAAREAGERRL